MENKNNDNSIAADCSIGESIVSDITISTHKEFKYTISEYTINLYKQVGFSSGIFCIENLNPKPKFRIKEEISKLYSILTRKNKR